MENVRNMPVQHLEEELHEMEDCYSCAFVEESSPEVLLLVWDRIKELRREIEKKNGGSVP